MPSSLFTPASNIFTVCMAGGEKLAAALIFKGFPPTNKCTIMTTWAQSHIFSQPERFDCGTAILSSCSSTFLKDVDQEKRPVLAKKHEHKDHPFFFFLKVRSHMGASWETQRRKHYQTIFTCLILFVWEELLSTTYLSQEELFSQIFIVGVICYNM